jgi:hypothetical protein
MLGRVPWHIPRIFIYKNTNSLRGVNVSRGRVVNGLRARDYNSTFPMNRGDPLPKGTKI